MQGAGTLGMAKTNTAVVVNPLREAGAQARASLSVLVRSVEKTQVPSQPAPKSSASTAKSGGAEMSDTRTATIVLSKHPYTEVEDIVDRAVAYGWRRAHKHTSKPTAVQIHDAIVTAVMCDLAENAEFRWKPRRKDAW